MVLASHRRDLACHGAQAPLPAPRSPSGDHLPRGRPYPWRVQRGEGSAWKVP